MVHGGDVFNRSRVATSLAWQAFDPLMQVASRGVPVFVVPGNHERGRIPQLRFAHHSGIFLFDRPRTFVAEVRGTRVALAGFPSERNEVRRKFTELVEGTGWRDATADVRLLCMHQCVEGATVGPGNFTFATADDVIRGSDIPSGFAAVLSGHIHRHQVLTADLGGRPLAAPVLYPGSIERTSIAEADEEKGFLHVHVATDESVDGERVNWRFQRLPARPLVRRELAVGSATDDSLEAVVRSLISEAPADAVLTIRVEGALTEHAARVLSAANLRLLAPASMNVELRFGERYTARAGGARRSPSEAVMPELPFQ